jgi:hypothetical protein
METFLIITDFLLLLFWVRLWSLPDRELYFNPLLSAPTRLTDSVLDFLRPVLPVPGRLTALLLVVFLLVFRAVALNHFLAGEPWVITVGSYFRFSPHAPGLHGALTFSALHFLFFVARYWGVYVLIQILTPVLRRDRASEAFHFAALPLAALQRWAQILLLLTVHGVLVYELSVVGALNTHLPAGVDMRPLVLPAADAAGRLPYLICLILFSVADLLLTAWQLMFALLVGSFAAVMLQNAALNAICNEGVATLLGGIRKRLLIGFIDLTPLLYMAGVYILYHIVVVSVLLAAMARIH